MSWDFPTKTTPNFHHCSHHLIPTTKLVVSICYMSSEKATVIISSSINLGYVWACSFSVSTFCFGLKIVEKKMRGRNATFPPSHSPSSSLPLCPISSVSSKKFHKQPNTENKCWKWISFTNVLYVIRLSSNHSPLSPFSITILFLRGEYSFLQLLLV